MKYMITRILNVCVHWDCRNLSGKCLEGNLTLDITRLAELQVLNLSSNAFFGEIPSFFGDSPSLEIL